MKQLEPFWRKALAEGKPIAADNPAGIEYLIDSVEHGRPAEAAAHARRAAGDPGPPDVTDVDRIAALDRTGGAEEDQPPPRC